MTAQAVIERETAVKTRTRLNAVFKLAVAEGSTSAGPNRESPYWSLRDYEARDQIGRDDSLGSYIASLVDAFDELRRVLRPDGTV